MQSAKSLLAVLADEGLFVAVSEAVALEVVLARKLRITIWTLVLFL